MTLLTGFAKKDITPDLSVAQPVLSGYIEGPDVGWIQLRDWNYRKAQDIRDPLFTRAIVVSDGSRKIAIANIDQLIINEELYEAVKAELERRRFHQMDLMLTATHTHHAPGQYWENKLASWLMLGTYDHRRFHQLVMDISDTIEKANRELKQSEVGYGEVEVPGWGCNRTFSNGKLDETVRIVKFTDMDGRPLYNILSYGVHPLALWPTHWYTITRDYPGALEDMLKQQLGTETVFVTGGIGSVQFNDEGDPKPGGETRLQRVAESLSSSVCAIYDDIHTRPGDVNFGSMRLKLGIPDMHWIPCKPKYRLIKGVLYLPGKVVDLGFGLFSQRNAKISAARIGDSYLVGLPCDIGFDTMTGEDGLLESSPPQTLALGLCNGYVGYTHRPEFFNPDSSNPKDDREWLMDSYERLIVTHGPKIGQRLVQASREVLEIL